MEQQSLKGHLTERDAGAVPPSVSAPRHYIASDYAGVSGGGFKFYYGYEYTNGEENGDEWCFVAWKGAEEIMRVPTSKLHVTRHAGMEEFLLAGISQWLERQSEKEPAK